jgi:uncharacterized protein YbjT (DUF2867 family)
MYVITGSTGNTSKPIALALLKAGNKVRVISRNAEKAKELIESGAELFVGDSTNAETLMNAFKDAEAVYALIPPNWAAVDFYEFQKNTADALAAAIEKNGVKYAVSLSSVGAQLHEDTGVVFGLHYMEEKFNKISGLNVLHLRPAYFMENTLAQAAVIKNMGIMGSPVKGDLNLSMIATKDIADYASKRLLKLDFKGVNAQYLLGQRDLTYNEVAGIYGEVIGKPDLKYVEFGYDDFKKSLMEYGASENMADRMNLFIKVLNSGKVSAGIKRDAESTTPTSIGEFSKIFTQVYNSN